MNDKKLMNLLNSVDNDLIDAKIDELLREKGEEFNMNTIKEKALNKLKESNTKKQRRYKKSIIAAALVASLTFATVYADEISKTINTLFNNKTILYSSIVDGKAYYLPKEIELNDELTLSQVAISKDHITMNLITNKEISDSEIEKLNISIQLLFTYKNLCISVQV